MSELKNAWKLTAKSAVIALNDLGNSLLKTAKVGMSGANEWAHRDNPNVQPQEGVKDAAEAETNEEAANEEEKTE